ncbi:hypothetical protein CP557_15340 [Natrinema ejinorense]|uniref:Uncharacterized protein n=1 Tax=Natrinema ejinorense TaxID=373386 RepID=A0A2A5QY77_9EURY|nr:hypothetical protein CP557_15340 [Natrinema ejinorense]
MFHSIVNKSNDACFYSDRGVDTPVTRALSAVRTAIGGPGTGDAIVATESHCTPDRTTALRSVCKSFQLLL